MSHVLRKKPLICVGNLQCDNPTDFVVDLSEFGTIVATYVAPGQYRLTNPHFSTANARRLTVNGQCWPSSSSTQNLWYFNSDLASNIGTRFVVGNGYVDVISVDGSGSPADLFIYIPIIIVLF